MQGRIVKTRFNYSIWLGRVYEEFSMWYMPTLQPPPIQYTFNYCHKLDGGI